VETNTLPCLDPQAFRRKIAGLLDQETPLTEEANDEMRTLASSLVCLMAQLFGKELDRITLWSRIDSALKTACSKVRDRNMELFVNHCLEHVKADPGRACLSEGLGKLLIALADKPAEWRQAFTRFIETRIYAVLVRGKEEWGWKKLEMKTERGEI